MGLTFEPFRVWFVKHHPTRKKMDFQRETGLAPSSAAKVWEDRFPVRSDVIERICETYDLKVEEVIQMKKSSS
jgi:hypothetical protein